VRKWLSEQSGVAPPPPPEAMPAASNSFRIAPQKDGSYEVTFGSGVELRQLALHPRRALLLIGLVAVPVAVLMSVAWQGLAAALKPAAPVTSAPTTDAIGTALLMRDQYLIPFELSSLVLLAALVGSVYLARRRKGG